MRVDSQFFHVLSILKYNFDPFLVYLVMIFVVIILFTALPANRYTLAPGILGFLIMRDPRVRCTAEYMPGFRYIFHLTLSIYLKGKAQPPLSHGAHTRWLKRS
jgi:hypothetical protein